MNNRQVAAAFAAGAIRGRGSNFFIEGDFLYSYGRHFVVARRIPGVHGFDRFIIATASRSSSTSRHLSLISNAVPNWQAYYCYDPSRSAFANKEVAEHTMALLKQEMDKPRKRAATLARLSAHIHTLKVQFNAYLTALPTSEWTCDPFPLPVPFKAQP